MEYSEQMREFGSIMVERLDGVKRVAFAQKTAIDSDFPEWQARRTEHGSDYLRHESRREIFVSVVTLIENAQLSYLLLRDHLTDKVWWQQRLEDVSEDKRRSMLHEYAIMTKWFLLHGLFSVVEETLRSIQRAAPNDIPVAGPFKSFARVTTAVLLASNQGEYAGLFRLGRLTRNTIHTNGAFLPEDEQDVSLEYKGEEFHFEVGKPIEWLDDQRAVWFVVELTTAMSAIVRSEAVRRLDYCPRAQV